MRNVSVSLTDQHAAALEAEVASGDFASVSEVVRAALREFLDRAACPEEAQMLADYQTMRSGLSAGELLVDANQALHRLRNSLAE